MAVNATVGVSLDGQSVILTVRCEEIVWRVFSRFIYVIVNLSQATPPTGASRVIATSYAWADVPFMTVYTKGYDLPVLSWNATL